MLVAYLAAALLMTAVAAYSDPIPRYRGLAFDVALYFALGLLWPVALLACVLLYIRGNQP